MFRSEESDVSAQLTMIYTQSVVVSRTCGDLCIEHDDHLKSNHITQGDNMVRSTVESYREVHIRHVESHSTRRLVVVHHVWLVWLGRLVLDRLRLFDCARDVTMTALDQLSEVAEYRSISKDMMAS